MGTTLLETRKLRKDYSGIVAVDGVTVTVDSDAVYAVVGPNGAGKTTFFRLLSGSTPPSSGQILFRGEDLTGMEPYEIARRGISRSYQITNIFPNISVLENLAVAIQSTPEYNAYNFWRSTKKDGEIVEQADEILEMINLTHKRDEDVENLSYGQQRMLEVGVTLATDPDLLLLDEPANGLSTDNTREMIELIRSIGEHLTVMFIEHNMSVVDQVADQVLVMNQGKVIVEGTPSEIRGDELVQRIYLQEEVEA